MLQSVASRIGRFMPVWHQRPVGAPGPRRHWKGARIGAYHLSALLPGLSLSSRFAFAAAIILCNGMAILGGWVLMQIERELSQNAALTDSAYVQGLLSPIVPLLAARERDTAQIAAAVDRSLRLTPLWSRLTSVAIWQPDGTIAYSTHKDLTGKKFPVPGEVQDALGGEVRTTLLDKRLRMLFRDKRDEGAIRTVYAPLHEKDGGKVIAVIEIVSGAQVLEAQLDSIRRRTWIVVGLTTLLMIGVLFAVVQNGSQTIEAQRLEIERRLEEEIRLGEVNKALRERLQEANRRGIELGEEQLRRISSELENGPVQLLALALLRMYELKPDADEDEPGEPRAVSDVVDVIAQATAGAMRELRDIASGLPLPELRRLSAHEAVERAVLAHETATGTAVKCDLSSFPDELPLPVTICMFRVVQEGLANAYSHAGGLGQSVTASCEEESVTLTVGDAGPGFSTDEALKPGRNLGLRWLRQRVESIGGTLTIRSAPGQGTQLSARFPNAPPPRNGRDSA